MNILFSRHFSRTTKERRGSERIGGLKLRTIIFVPFHLMVYSVSLCVSEDNFLDLIPTLFPCNLSPPRPSTSRALPRRSSVTGKDQVSDLKVFLTLTGRTPNSSGERDTLSLWT